LALAHYRAGQLEKATRRLDESSQEEWGNAAFLNGYVRALVLSKQGQGEQARQWLDRARGLHNGLKPSSAGNPVNLPATDWLEAEVLRREGEKVIETVKAPIRK